MAYQAPARSRAPEILASGTREAGRGIAAGISNLGQGIAQRNTRVRQDEKTEKLKKEKIAAVSESVDTVWPLLQASGVVSPDVSSDDLSPNAKIEMWGGIGGLMKEAVNMQEAELRRKALEVQHNRPFFDEIELPWDKPGTNRPAKAIVTRSGQVKEEPGSRGGGGARDNVDAPQAFDIEGIPGAKLVYPKGLDKEGNPYKPIVVQKRSSGMSLFDLQAGGGEGAGAGEGAAPVNERTVSVNDADLDKHLQFMDAGDNWEGRRRRRTLAQESWARGNKMRAELGMPLRLLPKQLGGDGRLVTGPGTEKEGVSNSAAHIENVLKQYEQGLMTRSDAELQIKKLQGQ